jgi:hypothetical protein
MFVKNIHATSILTITPTTSTIDGSATLVVYPGTSVMLTSDGTNYTSVVIAAVPWRYSAKTANYTLLPIDVRPTTVFNFTTASVTLSTAVAASNFTGQLFVVMNTAATGDVTFDPTGAETIDGASTLVIHPGQTFFIISDGTTYRSIANNILQKSGAIASKTASYTITTADRGKSVRWAGLAANVTATLPPAATCGDGFVVFLSNEDTSTSAFSVTVDPNGAELIDGSANRVMCTGSRVMLLCDGTGWRTVSGRWRYVSPEQTITVTGALALAHGLGVKPLKVEQQYKCTTADGGYSVNDYLIVPMFGAESSIGGSSCVPDATNLNIRFGQIGGWTPRKDTGAPFNMTASSWKAVFIAED